MLEVISVARALGFEIPDSLAHKQIERTRTMGAYKASTLIDLSTLGAQIVSTHALQSQRSIRMALPRDEGPLICHGRVVWAAPETAPGSGGLQYRAGVQFTEADRDAVAAFAAEHRVPTVAAQPSCH